MKLFRINSALSALRALVGWPLLVIGLYMAAALIGSHIPANAGWSEPDEGVDLFVETNGVHVSLIVPVSSEGETLSDLIRPEHLSDRALYGTHAMIGWGHAGVYRNAETWGQVRSGDVGSAIFGSDDVLLHVYHLTNPGAVPDRKKFRVTRAQYALIIADIRASFKPGATVHAAYGPDNLFYEAKGRYTAIHTCNEWTAGVLRRAGVRIGIWTPMPGGVMRWF